MKQTWLFLALGLGAMLLGVKFWGLFLLGWGLSKAFQAIGRKRTSKKRAQAPGERGPWRRLPQAERPPLGTLSSEPDGPVPFGYKTRWMAVRCSDVERVIAELRPRSRQRAGWTSGLAAAAQPGMVFVSPCLDGLILVVGSDCVPFAPDAFPEIQFFATHRVTDFHCWEKYVDGAAVRRYGYAGEEGAVLWDEGALTPEELSLGFARFPHWGDAADCEASPCEEDVLHLAVAWGVDPKFTENTYPPSAGWLCAV